MCCVKRAALQNGNQFDKVSYEIIGTKDLQTIDDTEKESNIPHLNQRAPKEDDKKFGGFEGQSVQMLERDLRNDTMELEDDASSKTCRMSKEESTKNLPQDLGVEVNIEPELSSIEKPMLTIIVSLCGLLLQRCWQKSKRMMSLKFEHEYIVLRPRCIEYLRALLSNFNVGIWSAAANDAHVMKIIKILERKAKEEFPFFMIWVQSQCSSKNYLP